MSELGAALVDRERVIPIHEAESQRQQATTSYLGMVVFLGSWTMMFGSLFFIYASLRLRYVTWPPPGFSPLPLLIPGLNTLVVAASSGGLVMATRALVASRLVALSRWLVVVIALGALFLGLQTLVWLDLWNGGFRASSGIYPSVFYTLTCFHALHVLVGLALLLVALPSVFNPENLTRRRNLLRLSIVFWHFVAAVWLLIFLFVYVL